MMFDTKCQEFKYNAFKFFSIFGKNTRVSINQPKTLEKTNVTFHFRVSELPNFCLRGLNYPQYLERKILLEVRKVRRSFFNFL